MKECRNCKHWGYLTCPNSDECYALPDKPHFEAVTNDTCNVWLDKMHSILDKILDKIEKGENNE